MGHGRVFRERSPENTITLSIYPKKKIYSPCTASDTPRDRSLWVAKRTTPAQCKGEKGARKPTPLELTSLEVILENNFWNVSMTCLKYNWHKVMGIYYFASRRRLHWAPTQCHTLRCWSRTHRPWAPPHSFVGTLPSDVQFRMGFLALCSKEHFI